MSDLSIYQSKMPGVYIEEISAGSNPIVGVGTSTAAFIGKAATAGDDIPTPITSWNQFVKTYSQEDNNPFATATATLFLPYAVYCFFNEGGTRCYVVNESSTYDGETTPAWFEELQKIDDINIIAFPDTGGLDDPSPYIQLGYEYCYEREYCFFIIDSPKDNNTPTEIKTFVSGIGDIQVTIDGEERSVKDMGLNKYSAVYFPWLKITNPSYSPYGDTRPTITVPPSGAIAGIYARTDANRGVWKAPAGLSDGRIYSAKDVNLKFSEQDYGDLNCHNINAIRNIKDTGVCVWGARTVVLFTQEQINTCDDTIIQTEWKYINIRRLFNYIEESLYEGNQWVVFEPNGTELWSIVNRNITAFLTDQWKDGAFYGTTAEEAFFVKVDKDNNPPDLREQGFLIIDVGIAPIYPAEFVIIRITQKMQTE
jgi:phage tail sheath protein FI